MKARTIMSHGLALATGLALAASFTRRNDTDQKAKDTAAHASNSASGPSSDRRRSKTAASTRTEEYQRAWNDLARQKMSEGRRRDLQWRLLEAWAMIDLEAALKAEMAEAPWAARGAFDKAFMAQPLASWKTLSKLGLGSMRNTVRWTQMVALKDPDAMISVIDEMPPSLQSYAADFLFSEVETDPQADALRKKLLRPGSITNQERDLALAWRAAPLRPQDSIRMEAWLDLPAGSERLNAMTGWANGSQYADLATLETDWAKVPAADREQAARLLLSQLSLGSEHVTFAIDRAIETGQWDMLRKLGGAPAHSQNLMEVEPETLATWAMQLPQRDELRAYFTDAVTPKLMADPAAGREWLESMPADSWQRDEGYAAIARASLARNRNQEEALRAIGSISNPAIRQRAREELRDWQVANDQREILHGE
ncbi:hypothetical protein OJ996_00700 [Luteolibacter sp. GHJ8]|uniref:HEAT repeat protein n=1 Tax=Luteolibacter rhizosphaerae TaxID=2989719 RepID=A0ABT3FWW2_9BACT|nr:hypothetical protein [Luteolibacter rhizosphaerae]MCW1912071.1 hypothetical protein [Luteolibacter rhizosphaerae]